LWVALAYGSGVTYFATNLSWWVGITAIVSFFVGAYVMGWLGGNNRYRGWGPGLVNPFTMWGLLVIATTLAGGSVAQNAATYEAGAEPGYAADQRFRAAG
jgi:hypothetical protein